MEKTLARGGDALRFARKTIGHSALKFAEIVDPAIKFENETDALSGLLTFDAFKCYYEANVNNNRRARLEGAKDYLLLADLDNFGQFNKTRGHLYGDSVIADIGSRIKEVKRTEDLACRRGGDEFMVLFHDALALDPIVQNLRHLNEQIYADYQQLTSVSMGMVEVRRGDDFSLVHKLADAALSDVKLNGRNDIRVYERFDTA